MPAEFPHQLVSQCDSCVTHNCLAHEICLFSSSFNLMSKNILLLKTYNSDGQKPKVLLCTWQEGVFASTSSASKE